MGNKVFCGGLAWGTSEDNLKTAMAQFGPVEGAKIIMDRDTGKSKGFGFVTFIEDAGAEAAVAAETVELDGRKVRMDLAKERAPRSGGGSPRGGSGAGGRGGKSSQEHGGGGRSYEDEGGGGGGGRDRGGRGKRRDKGGGGYNDGGGYSSGSY